MIDLALESSYTTTVPNEPLSIYSGEMLVKQDAATVKGQGSLELRWLPNPRIIFSLNTKDFSIHDIHHGDAQLMFSSTKRHQEVPICILSKSIGTSNSLGGRAYPVEFGDKEANLSNVTFHLSNFIDYIGNPIKKIKGSTINNWAGRIELKPQEWVISIDKVQNFEVLKEHLKLEGGYAITHTCQLKKPNNQTFTTKEAQELLWCLRYFLSFVRGLWCQPTLITGFDEKGNKIWELLSSPSATPYKDVHSWIPVFDLDTLSLSDALQKFIELWKDNLWREAMSLSIHWYLEANGNSNVETSIVLAQTGLEALYYIKNVEKGSLSLENFERMEAHQRIRNLLLDTKFQIDIPNNLHELSIWTHQRGTKIGDETVSLTGPEAITQMRNGIIHPNIRERVSTSSVGERLEAKKLGILYLELALLFSLGYKGKYENRCGEVINEFTGAIEKVPWT
jgi:hypothetical protein